MNELAKLATALNAFQAEVVVVGKDASNPFFKSKYAPLDSIMKAALPVLTKHGLAITQLLDNIDGQSALTTQLLHVSGESISSTMPLLLAKNDPQGQGSAITYARRYSYAAVLGIVIDDDDDGNRASTQVQAPIYKTLNGMATDKQRELIKQKLQQAGIAIEDQAHHLIGNYGVDVPLTKEGANYVLDDMLGAS